MTIIPPRTLKGFRDLLPEAMAAREHVVEVARAVCRSFGFAPIETPALEYSEILLGKGGDESDKQLYRFFDQGDRDVALRFDLTVPLARFAAQHVGELGTPFKRYHVGPVWRGENTQRGRYREFVQFDFDTIGTEGIVADVETLVVVHELFAALGFERFTIHLNNRHVLNGVLERIGLSDRSEAILRSLDKLAKIGPDGVTAELTARVGLSTAAAGEVLALTTLTDGNSGILAGLRELVGDREVGRTGIDQLQQTLDGVLAAGVDESRIRIDVSIARGLAYYTGTVFETTLDDVPDIGSVCSGGRYDDLASLYTKQRLPGIGGSLGVDRLLVAMDELGLIEGGGAAADVFVVFFAADRRNDYIALASGLRRSGIDAELFPEPRKLKAQLKYADRRGHRLAVIVGEDEWEAGVAQVKRLADGSSRRVPLTALAAACREALTT